MKRFRLDHSRISNASPETDTKDNNDVNVGHADPEEEKFEWKEISRGWIFTPYLKFMSLLWYSNNIIGLFDIQAWLTGLATLGLLVGLYSYSLFLFVSDINWSLYLFNVFCSPTIVAGLGYTGSEAQLHTGWFQSSFFSISLSNFYSPSLCPSYCCYWWVFYPEP